MSYKLFVQPIAFEDMESIGDYIALTLCSPKAALNLLAKFNEGIERLKSFPFSGDLLETQYPLEYEYRRIIVENYIIFYTVDEQNQTVNVMRVLFGSSNYLSVLN